MNHTLFIAAALLMSFLLASVKASASTDQEVRVRWRFKVLPELAEIMEQRATRLAAKRHREEETSAPKEEDSNDSAFEVVPQSIEQGVGPENLAKGSELLSQGLDKISDSMKSRAVKDLKRYRLDQARLTIAFKKWSDLVQRRYDLAMGQIENLKASVPASMSDATILAEADMSGFDPQVIRKEAGLRVALLKAQQAQFEAFYAIYNWLKNYDHKKDLTYSDTIATNFESLNRGITTLSQYICGELGKVDEHRHLVDTVGNAYQAALNNLDGFGEALPTALANHSSNSRRRRKDRRRSRSRN